MQIAISSISPDIENFRHGHVNSEREAIQSLLSDEKTHKVAELAEDIVDMKGLDPSSLLIVLPDPDNAGHYIALEGNRRITAIKTLMNPELATNLPTYGTFKKLSPEFAKLGITTAECVVANSRAEAKNWIKRKHYNAMGGKGTMAWNAIATARSDAVDGRYTRWLMVLHLLEKFKEPTGALLDGVSSKVTTVERVFSSKHMSSELGITFDSKTALPVAENGDARAAASLLKAMLLAMADPTFVETLVSSAAQQLEYIQQFSSQNVKKKKEPSKSKPDEPTSGSSERSSEGSSNSKSGDKKTGEERASSKSSASDTARSKPVRFRKELAAKGLRINNDALNKLYAELRGLKVEKNRHIASAMVRVFLEKVTLVYLEDMSISSRNPHGWRDANVKLKDKIAGALHQIDPSKNNPRLGYVWDIANGVKDKLHTLDLLNQAIHDHVSLPSERDIVTIWDRYHPYFEELFKALENNGK